MDLACVENLEDTSIAERDRNIYDDNRVLENLRSNEYKYMPKINYFTRVQIEIMPYMRKMVITWLMDICEEQMIEEQVLPLAINLMDRFLCVCNIKKQHLQLLAAACLLISSKLRSTNLLTIGLLQEYTEYSVKRESIEKWEFLVLSKLNWDINGVTAFDYIEQVIQRCPWGLDDDRLRRHVNTLLTICYCEERLIGTFPSVVAAACISSAIRGLKLPSAEEAILDICKTLKMSKARMEVLGAIIENIVTKLSKGQDSRCPSPYYMQASNSTTVEDDIFFNSCCQTKNT